MTAGGQQVGVIRDVSLASAQALAASTCPTAGITPEALQALDANDTQVPGETCASLGSGLTFTFAQNGLAAENAPGEASVATPSSPSTAAPTTAR